MSRTKTKTVREANCAGSCSCATAPLAAALTPAELAAVARVGLQAAKTRDELKPGLHRIDATLRFSGAVIVGEPQPGGTTTQYPSAELLLGHVINSMQPAVRKRLQNYLRDMVGAWVAGGEETKLAPEQAAKAAEFMRHLGRQVESPGRRGSVTGAIDCKLIKRHE